jgi:hypothetical protein
LVEHQPSKLRVASSSLVSRSNSSISCCTMVAHVAQLVERILGKDEVTGSTPVVGSMLTLVAFLEKIFNGLRRQENVEEKI